MEKVDLDLSDATRTYMDFYSGKKDETKRKEAKVVLNRAEAILQAARKAPGGATFAVAADSVLSQKIHMFMLDQPIDADEFVALAEEAYKTAPSSGSHRTLLSALLFRAASSLAQQDPTFAELAAKTKRSLGPIYLIPWILSQDGNLRQAVEANRDFQRAVDVLLDTNKRFPRHPSSWDWAMVRTVHPQEATQIAQTILKDELRAVERLINRRLSPLSAAVAFDEYWECQLAGKEAQGLEVLKAAAARGVPLPPNLK
jgi:hypothetical protein